MLSPLNGAICGMACWELPDLTSCKRKQEAGLIENPNIFNPSSMRKNVKIVKGILHQKKFCRSNLIFWIVRGGIKKNCFFSEKLRKGGGGVSPNPKLPYQKKLRFFWIVFFKRGGSHIFQNWGFLDIFAKRGVTPNP